MLVESFTSPHAVSYISSLKLAKELNNLEKDVLTYMTCPQDLEMLKVDGLLFDQIYADMMVLLKSKKLGVPGHERPSEGAAGLSYNFIKLSEAMFGSRTKTVQIRTKALW